MISYLDAVRSLVDKSIYGRGVKSFLEGGVVSFQDLTLDAWRKYQVKDTNTETVMMPLLHLALDIHKWDKAGSALQESAYCSCQYFQEFGTCKHIVAVCAALEQEFIQSKKNAHSKQEITTSLNSLFEFSNNKEQRDWLNKVYQYFERSRFNLFPWISQVVRATSQEGTSYDEFWLGFSDICFKATEDFDQEKKLAQLIVDSMITGSMVWWSFWLKLFPSLHPTHLVKIITELWFQAYTLKHDYLAELNYFIQTDTTNLNLLIMNELEAYPNSEKLKVELALQTKMKDWLEENLRNLDPLSLIEMAVIFPDLLEEIQLNLLGQLKVWTDFITPQGSDEIREVMQVWRNKLGDTVEYQEMKNYLKQSFPKRKKLWSDL